MTFRVILTFSDQDEKQVRKVSIRRTRNKSPSDYSTTNFVKPLCVLGVFCGKESQHLILYEITKTFF